MKRFAETLIVLGIAVILFGAVIPFADWFSDEIENIIYFRFIILGLLFACIGCAILMRGLFQNLIISLGGGVISLGYVSTMNLIFNDWIHTYYYFLVTFLTVLLFIIILIFIRIWYRILHRFKSYKG